MAQKSEDRRSRRSRALLKAGLLELMLEKKFSDISVRDVTERIDLNRGTFYLHYPDTTALLQSAEADMLDGAQALMDQHFAQSAESGSLRPVFLAILDYIAEHPTECTALFFNNSTSGFFVRLQELIRRNGVSLIQKKYRLASQMELDYFLSFVGYGLIGLIKTWFDQGMALPREELAALADCLVSAGASQLLEVQPNGTQ